MGNPRASSSSEGGWGGFAGNPGEERHLKLYWKEASIIIRDLLP